MQAILNVLVMTVLLIFMFSVIGVGSFKGTFGSCNDLTRTTNGTCTGVFQSFPDGFGAAPTLMNREWKTPFYNFDNVGRGMLTLLASATTEGWADVMYMASDATSLGNGPLHNTNPAASLYFLVFMVLVAFYMMSVFVGYVIVVFGEVDERRYRSLNLSKNQRQCIAYVLEAKPAPMYQPVYRFQHAIHKIAASRLLEVFIMLCIVANTVCLLTQYHGMTREHTARLALANYVFVSIFAAEALLKLVAFNPTNYFLDGWNVMDFGIVIGSLVELTLEDGGSFGFLRLFRVARIFKIVNKGYQMQQLLTTFVQSFKALPYVVILLGLAFFMFAILGMNLFGDIVITDDFSKPLNTYSNFGSFGISLLTLFKCITGESWHAVMATCYEEKGWLALPFFVTFVILCNFLMINLFIAVIMDNFQYLTQDVSTLNVHHLKRFSQTWSELDPAGTHSRQPLISSQLPQRFLF